MVVFATAQAYAVELERYFSFVRRLLKPSKAVRPRKPSPFQKLGDRSDRRFGFDVSAAVTVFDIESSIFPDHFNKVFEMGGYKGQSICPLIPSHSILPFSQITLDFAIKDKTQFT